MNTSGTSLRCVRMENHYSTYNLKDNCRCMEDNGAHWPALCCSAELFHSFSMGLNASVIDVKELQTGQGCNEVLKSRQIGFQAEANGEDREGRAGSCKGKHKVGQIRSLVLATEGQMQRMQLMPVHHSGRESKEGHRPSEGKEVDGRERWLESSKGNEAGIGDVSIATDRQLLKVLARATDGFEGLVVGPL